MSIFIKNYVDGCATCQATKNNMHPIKPPNQPITTPAKPWSVITLDFIMDLPKINGFNSINVVVVTIWCNRTINFFFLLLPLMTHSHLHSYSVLPRLLMRHHPM